MSEYSNIVTSKLKLRCLLCDRAFFRIQSLHNRSGTRHQTRCSRSRCRGALDIHRRLLKGENPYSCRECGQDYATPEMLAYHTEQEHKKQQHFCAICRKLFNDHGNLALHMRDTHCDVEQAEEAEEAEGSGSDFEPEQDGSEGN